MKNIILLGGAPAIGKSTVAQKLADRLGVPCISTDDIRAEMRTRENKNDSPPLFFLDKTTVSDPADFLSAISVNDLLNVVDGECREVWRGVLNIIENSKDSESFIIEGVAILPEKAAILERQKNNIKVIILINSDPGLIRNTIYSRGLGGSPNLFPEELKHKQMKWVDASNKRYKQEALKHGLEVFDIADSNHIGKIIESVSKVYENKT